MYVMDVVELDLWLDCDGANYNSMREWRVDER